MFSLSGESIFSRNARDVTCGGSSAWCGGIVREVICEFFWREKRDRDIEKEPFKEERFVYLLFAAAFLCGGHPEFLCGVLAYGPPGVLSGYCVIASKRPTGASCDHLLVSRLLLLACNSNRLGDVIRSQQYDILRKRK